MKEAVEILNLMLALTPTGVSLIKAFATSLDGVPDEQILTEADSRWASVVAKAKSELGQ